MKLIENWRAIWHRLWSVRLSLLAALLSAIEAGLSYWLSGQPPVVALLGSGVSLGAAIARLVAQPEVHDATAK